MIDVNDDRRLQAVVLAMKGLDRDLKRDINKGTRETMNPVWKAVVSAHATSHFDTKMLTVGVRIAAGNPPRAVAAASRRAIGKGKRITPGEDYHLAEFGSPNREKYSRYERRSKNGGTHTVSRRAARGVPRFDRRGRVVYPAFAELAPRMVSLWVQTVVLKTYETFEKGQ